MRFHPTEEQLAIQDAVRGTLVDALPAERLHALVDGDADFDAESWQKLMDLGLGGLMMPETVGGSALGLVDAAMVIEMCGQAAAPGPLIDQIVAGIALSTTGNAAARDLWCHGIATGERRAALAFGGAWLPESWNGEARFVTAARSADLFLVGTPGGGLAVVEAGDGVEITPVPSSDRTRRLSSVRFDGARMEEIFAAGDPAVARIFDAALVLAAADALGGAQHCLDISVAYAKEREQFGQPIGRFQALKHQLATMAMEVEPARALLWYAAYAWDGQLPDAPRAAAMAKAHIADRFVSVARAAVAAHGGIGYTWEYGLVIWFRRSLYDRAWLGSPAVHRSRAADLATW
jgi:alkylation response protein AidB-like acyl-CoA dehydrogenase